MAERRGARRKQDLTPDELAPAADERGDALTIVGILGEGTDSGSVRLFLDAQFQTYYEIPSEAILRRTRVPAERSPLGVDSSAVVVRKGAELVVHRASTRRVEEEFLSGDFTAPGSFTPPPGPGAGPREPTMFGCDTIFLCPSGPGGCPTVDFCPSLGARCFTQAPDCVTQGPACFTMGTRCPTLGPPCLPTQDVSCPTQDPRCWVGTHLVCRLTHDLSCRFTGGLQCPSRVCVTTGGECLTWECWTGFGGGGQVGG
jgi:hypothetical protein